MAANDHPLRRRLVLLGWAFALLGLSILAIVLFALQTVSTSLIVVWIGFPFTVGMVALVRRHADLQRLLAARVAGVRIPRAYRPLPDRGLFARLGALLRDPATWRDYAWMLLSGPVGIAMMAVEIGLFFGGLGHLTLATWWWALPEDAQLDLLGFLTVNDTASAITVGIPVGVLYLAVWWWITPRMLPAYALVAKKLLAPPGTPSERARLAQRVAELTESRAETVDTQAAELRRIERDLHDGAQARLVALGMSLGMAEEVVARNPQAALELLAEAREASTQALAELRDLVRGIHPPVLADRGLPGAIEALALTHALPTDVEIDIPGRLTEPVESAAYFAVAETLTNVVKHANASKAWIRLRYEDGKLSILVGDDGRGGADPSRGSGLQGIERRLAAFDGTLVVTSPLGGPTVVVMDLPAELAANRSG